MRERLLPKRAHYITRNTEPMCTIRKAPHPCKHPGTLHSTYTLTIWLTLGSWRVCYIGKQSLEHLFATLVNNLQLWSFQSEGFLLVLFINGKISDLKHSHIAGRAWFNLLYMSINHSDTINNPQQTLHDNIRNVPAYADQLEHVDIVGLLWEKIEQMSSIHKVSKRIRFEV